MHACRRLVLILMLCWARTAFPQPAGGLSESAIKAAFLLNFANYVEWPAAAMGAPGDPIVMGVIGDDEVYAELERQAVGRRAGGRPFALQRLREPLQQARVHMAFIGVRRESRAAELIEAIEGPTLVVAQSSGALEEGAMINFVTQERRVRFEVSAAQAQARGLRLSARLLGVAISVDGKPQ